MKMKLESVREGADGEIVLRGDVHDLRGIRAWVGKEVEVEIRPVNGRFHYGDRVWRKKCDGVNVVEVVEVISTGPHYLANGVFWTTSGSNGEMVKDEDLTPFAGAYHGAG